MLMNTKTTGPSKTLIVLILMTVAVIMYILAMYYAAPVFQQTRITDPLAEYHSLPLLFFIAIGLITVLSVVCLVARIGNKYLFCGLVVLLAMMLWLTPYWLTGYVRFMDSTWHVGAAMKIPQVINGEIMPLTSYAAGYPGSYLYHYSLIKILGIQPLTYTDLFPLFSLSLFVLLSFVLITRLFSSRVAFLALLLAIPGLHYIQLHASPHILGAILMLTAFVFLVRRSYITLILACLAVIAMIFSHPTSPMLFMIFLGAVLLTFIIRYRRIRSTQLILAGILIIVFAGWLLHYTTSAHTQIAVIRTTQDITMPKPANNTSPAVTPTTPAATPAAKPAAKPSATPSAAEQISGDLLRKLSPSDMDTGQKFIGGTPFIYAGIYNLNKGVYFFYGAAVILAFLWAAFRSYRKKRNIRIWLSRLGNFKFGEIILMVSIPLLLLLTLLLAEQNHDLIETGLTYIILAASCFIASFIIRMHPGNKKSIFVVICAGALFLTMTFPVVAYSIDAYSSAPRSEEAGLEFLAAKAPLERKSISGRFMSQICLYISPSIKHLNFTREATGNDRPDMAVFRNTGYYYSAMRFDFSFKENGYTRALTQIESLNYEKVYSSPTFKLYLKGQTTQ
jgi:hypothetical protein